MLGAIWDLDGTLVDTEQYHFMSWSALLREHGRTLTPEQFKPTFGRRNSDVLRGDFGFTGDDAEISALSDRKEWHFRGALEREGVQFRPGARELVDHLHALGFKQAIASSAPPLNIEISVRLSGLADRLDAVVSSEEVLHGKPAPDIVLRAAERIGVAPAASVVFEDAPAGIAAGKAAGTRVIAITGSFPRPELAAADLIVESFEDVLWPLDEWERWLRVERVH